MLDLGLAISGMSMVPGQRRTIREIAGFCCYDPVRKRWGSVSSQRISQIEMRALRRIRAAIYRDAELKEALGSFLMKK